MAAHQAPRSWDSPGKNTGVGCHFLLQCMKVKSESEVAQSCPTLSDSMDCSLPGSFIHGIFQARVLERVAIEPCKTYLMRLDSNFLFFFLHGKSWRIFEARELQVIYKGHPGDCGRVNWSEESLEAEVTLEWKRMWCEGGWATHEATDFIGRGPHSHLQL